jgi:hypothetical protein
MPFQEESTFTLTLRVASESLQAPTGLLALLVLDIHRPNAAPGGLAEQPCGGVVPCSCHTARTQDALQLLLAYTSCVPTREASDHSVRSRRRRNCCCSPRCLPARPHCSAGGKSFRSMKDWRAPQNASRVSTAALNPALRSLMVLTKATGPAGAPYANAKSAC